MGLFGKIFDKKECSICGGEIGLLGNRKLEDGNLCKECAAKLSPWVGDRRQSTVEEIQKQLSYREANQARVSSFRTTRTLGERMKVLLDEDAGLFMVTPARNPVSYTHLMNGLPALPFAYAISNADATCFSWPARGKDCLETN